NSVTQVKRVFYNVADNRMRPDIFIRGVFEAFCISFFTTLVKPPGRAGNLLLLKMCPDTVSTPALGSKLKYLAYNPCSFFVNNQAVMIVRCFPVSDRIEGGAI